MNKTKDNRKVITNQVIRLEGNAVTFDGKYNPDTNTLKVYKYHGDINLREQALQDYAITNRIDTVIIL